jgi:hypothetical protein
MKQVISLLLAINILSIACNSENKKNAATKASGAVAGKCTKCSCPSFREDATEDACLNIQPPSQKLCGHKKSEHK